MIQKTLTGIPIDDINTVTDIPCAINDTFISKTPINFIVSLSMLNSLIGTSINSGNISSYSLFVRIMNVETTGTFLSNIFTLSTSNITNNFLNVDLRNITDSLTNDYILLHATDSDIHNLFKKFKIVFRIFQNSLGVGNQQIILSNDIVSDLNICLNTYETGPYDVNFLQLDILSPSDFSISERQAAFTKCPSMLGAESVRCFYPSNISTQMPVLVYAHGNQQYVEGFDSYLSTFASYGYFCISIYITPEIFLETGEFHILTLLDHIKVNISKIDSGRFNGKLDFNKIIFIGLSLSGAFVESIAMQMKRKNAEYSRLNTISFNYTDIKAIITLGSVGRNTVGVDGIVNKNYKISNFFSECNPDEDSLNYLTVDHDIPLMMIHGLNDNEGLFGAYVNHIFNPGFSYTDKLNHLDKYILISNREHNGLIDLTSNSDIELSFSITNRFIDNHYLNSNRLVLNEHIAWILYFLGINVFSSNKLKKLRYVSPHKQKIDNVIKNNPKTAVFHSFYPVAEDIKIQIDNFYGITLSYAGSTGFTLNNPLGFTFDYTMDSAFYTIPPTIYAQPGQTFIDGLFELKSISTLLDFDIDQIFKDNDTYNGIIFNSYKSLFTPIESNIILGYTFQNSISLTENNYIGLRACQTHIHGISGISKNNKYSNFNLTLIDESNNSATISSKNYSSGFYPQTKIDNRINPDYIGGFPTIPNFSFFRAGDFFMKNQSLDITKINQMRLDFGPDYGSTFSHIALDAFVVYKEL